MTKEDNEIIQLSNELEVTFNTEGWKYIKGVMESMYVDIVGGLDKEGNLVPGAIDDPKAKIDELLGYRQALSDLYMRIVIEPRNAARSIEETLKEEANLNDETSPLLRK